MKRIVWTFGLISGAIVSALFAIFVPMTVAGRLDFENAEVIGYSSMVLSFLLVFFGIRTYRENIGGGAITFGKAFHVGILITLISCVMYVASWLIVYYNFIPNFMDVYAEHMIANAEDKQATAVQMAQFKEWYKNPLLVIGFTFLEVFPVGLIMTLISAGILRKKRPDGVPAVAALA
jgi:hypothetical protein